MNVVHVLGEHTLVGQCEPVEPWTWGTECDREWRVLLWLHNVLYLCGISFDVHDTPSECVRKLQGQRATKHLRSMYIQSVSIPKILYSMLAVEFQVTFRWWTTHGDHVAQLGLCSLGQWRHVVMLFVDGRNV